MESAFKKSSSVWFASLITSRKSLLLGSETCALVDRIIQLRVSICHLPAVHEELKTLYIVRVLRLLLRERRNL